MWHCSIDYWVRYCMFRSMGTKVLPRAAWPGLKVGNVTDWYQSMSGCSEVAYPALRLARGTLHQEIVCFLVLFPMN
jgi:hypothetical protein